MIFNGIEYDSIFNYGLKNTLMIFTFVIPIFFIVSLINYFNKKERKNFQVKNFLIAKGIIFILLFLSTYIFSLFNILLKDLESISFEKIELIDEKIFDIVSITEDPLKLVYRSDVDGSFIYINDNNFKDFKINDEEHQNIVVRGIYKGAKLFNFVDDYLYLEINKGENIYYVDEEIYNKIKEALNKGYLYKKEE